MARLAYSHDESGGWDVVKLNGDIVEGSKDILSQLSNTAGKHCIFDFRNISSINTCGIAEWIEFMAEFGKERDVLYDACSSNIIMLINMVPAFKGKAEVRSLFRTYFCDECSKTIEVPVVKDQNLPTAAALKSNPQLDDEINWQGCDPSHVLEAEVPADEFYEFVNEDA